MPQDRYFYGQEHSSAGKPQSDKKEIFAISGVSATIIALVLMLVGLSYSWGELWLRTIAFNMVKQAAPFWVLFFWGFLIPLCLVPVLITFAVKYFGKPKFSVPLGVAGVLLLLFSVMSFIPPAKMPLTQSFRNGHETRLIFAAQVTNSNDAHPEYLYRANSVQATERVNQMVNDLSVDTLTETQYSIANGEPAWCAGGMTSGGFWNRVYTTAVACITDSGKLVQAKFTKRIPSPGGSFSTRLSKQIAEAQPGLSVSDQDLRYGIKNGKPFLLVTTTKVTAGMHPRTVPGGVFFFDYKGTMTFDSHATRGEYGVAVVPYAVAEDIRGSLNDRAGYWCLDNLNKTKCLTKNTPYKSTSGIKTDSSSDETTVSDINSENFSEFVLIRKDGSIGMVTPLTNNGKGRNITAYLDVNADEVEAGVLPKATLYKGINEVAYVFIAQAITPAYTSDLTWISEINGSSSQSTASRIFEISPTKSGSMVATIGTATNPQYVVDIKSTLVTDSIEFSWCIYTAESKAGVANKLIECRDSTQGAAPIGTLRGLASSPAPVVPSVPATPIIGNSTGIDFGTLTEQELLDIISRASQELANR